MPRVDEVTLLHLPPTCSSTSGMSQPAFAQQLPSIITFWLILISCPTQGELAWVVGYKYWVFAPCPKCCMVDAFPVANHKNHSLPHFSFSCNSTDC